MPASAVSTPQDFQSTEKEEDGETGLKYFGARYLDAELGMWTATDPMGQYHHGYSFVGGNPLNFIDRWGLEGEPLEGEWDDSFWDVFQDRGGTWANNEPRQPAQTPDASNVFVMEPSRPFQTSILREAPDRGNYIPDEFERLRENSNFNLSKIAAENAPEAIETAAMLTPWGLPEGMLLRMGRIGKWILRVNKGEDAGKGLLLTTKATIRGSQKIDRIFANRSDAMNWARKHLGHNTTQIRDAKGRWTGLENALGDKVYWGHGDWGKGKGLSNFPHLNYDIGGTRGHLFLGDKIVNRGQWVDFATQVDLAW